MTSLEFKLKKNRWNKKLSFRSVKIVLSKAKLDTIEILVLSL